MAIVVDNDEAERILRREWNRVLNETDRQYVADDTIATTIREVLNASQLTYKYILVTNVLAKATNPAIHYRSMQAQWDHDGAYNARSLGHEVIVEWEKENGERLGGSNEPFLNKPARYPSFSMENSYRSESAHRRLYDLLERLEERTESGDVDPTDILRQTLQEISRLEAQTVDFRSPSRVPYRDLEPAVHEYLEVSGGGERLPSVVAGVLRTLYTHASSDDWTVEAEHANVPDEFSKAAGDVEIFRENELVRAAEVKDKPSERSDVQHAIRKARENELGEYLYVVGDGWRNEQEREAATDEIDAAPIEVVLVYPEDVISQLKFVGETGRASFVETVGEYLNDMRADEENKSEWKQLAERFGD